MNQARDRVTNRRVVVACSGGPWSLAVVTALARTGAEVVAVAVSVGQRRELDGVRDRARAAGSVRCHVLDREDTFAADVLWPAVRAGADMAQPAFVFVAPVLARALVDVARLEQAPVVAHAARGANARVLTAAIRALDPSLTVRAPLQDHATSGEGLGVDGEDRAGGAVSRVDEESSVRLPAVDEMHVDVSLLGRQVTGAPLPDMWDEVPADLWTMTRAPQAGPDEPARLELSFLHGRPVEVNGVSMPLVELLDSVGTIASAHGVGRRDEVRLDEVGHTARVLVETPALTTLLHAYRALARLASPDAAPAAVSGDVRLMLYKGGCHVIARRSTRYDPIGEHADAAVARSV